MTRFLKLSAHVVIDTKIVIVNMLVPRKKFNDKLFAKLSDGGSGVLVSDGVFGTKVVDVGAGLQSDELFDSSPSVVSPSVHAVGVVAPLGQNDPFGQALQSPFVP
jgi:hypothetical protein